MTNKEYKQWMIECILQWQSENTFTRESLEKKTTRALEIIFDNVK